MTAQFPEKLIYKGEELTLCETPLSLLTKSDTFHWKFRGTCTALWRGYVGTWCIEADRLYLKAIEIENDDDDSGGWKSLPLHEQFANSADGVFAHWYTGELRCPRGGLLKYVHGGYASTYEEDLFLKIQKGRLESERVVRNGDPPESGSSGYRVNAFYQGPRSEE